MFVKSDKFSEPNDIESPLDPDAEIYAPSLLPKSDSMNNTSESFKANGLSCVTLSLSMLIVPVTSL